MVRGRVSEAAETPALTPELRTFLLARYEHMDECAQRWEEMAYTAETRERVAWYRGRRSEVALMAQTLGLDVYGEGERCPTT